MDNGSKQGSRVMDVKAQIKQNASRRRTRDKRQTPASVICSTVLPVRSASSSPAERPVVADVFSSCSSQQSNLEQRRSQSADADYVTGNVAHRSFRGDQAAQNFADPHFILESVMLMSYLDQIFPILYPFYRPGISEGARCWLLPIVLSHDCLRHVVVALATQVMSTVETTPGSDQYICVALDRNLIHSQTEIALQTAQRELQTIISADLPSQNVLEKSKVLANTVQLMAVESYLGHNSWTAHLDAAVSLSIDILQADAARLCPASSKTGDEAGDSFSQIVDQLNVTISFTKPHPPLWTPLQASYRFHTALLVFADIISATTLRGAPKFAANLDHILLDAGGAHKSLSQLDSPPSSSPKLDLLRYFGVSNTMLLLIADIATSDAATLTQRRDQGKEAGTGLVASIPGLEKRIWAAIEELDAVSSVRATTKNMLSRTSYPSILNGILPTPSPELLYLTNRVWARAAWLYHLLTLGSTEQSQTGSQERFCAVVVEAIGLLETICADWASNKERPAWLRSMAWPICVTGLSIPRCGTQQQRSMKTAFGTVLTVLEGSGLIQAFGMVRHVRRAVEEFWSNDTSSDWSPFSEMLRDVLLI
jgi:C6 transcription factor Pro1